MSNPGAVSRETVPAPPPDEQVRAALCARYPAAAGALAHYADLLADAGVTRGLIGPRERPRLWGRHLANSAVLEEIVEQGVRVVDVGSGAGLPGLPLALVRPDLQLVLVEPLLRRATFLQEAVAELGLADRVEVRRSRAEDLPGPLGEVVTARAVAPLDRLAAWTLPLVAIGGTLLALKGSAATEEAHLAGAALARLGGGPAEVVQCGSGVVEPATTVVRVRRLRAGRGTSGGRARR